MLRRILPISVLLFSITACEGVSTPAPNSSSGQTWVCGREYVNQAWGYQRRGVVLDTAGNVWQYNIKSSPTTLVNPWQPKDVSKMSEEELKLRYNGAMTTGKKVPAEDVARHISLIEEASNATPTQPKSVGADMGQTLLYCYTYNGASRTYSQVMLDNKGDWESTNPSSAAKTLSTWLNAVLGDVN